MTTSEKKQQRPRVSSILFQAGPVEVAQAMKKNRNGQGKSDPPKGIVQRPVWLPPLVPRRAADGFPGLCCSWVQFGQEEEVFHIPDTAGIQGVALVTRVTQGQMGELGSQEGR